MIRLYIICEFRILWKFFCFCSTIQAFRQKDRTERRQILYKYEQTIAVAAVAACAPHSCTLSVDSGVPDMGLLQTNCGTLFYPFKTTECRRHFHADVDLKLWLKFSSFILCTPASVLNIECARETGTIQSQLHVGEKKNI